MKSTTLLMFTFLCCAFAFGQKQMVNEFQLTNGLKFQGFIMEYLPDSPIKIKTADGETVEIKFEEIKKITLIGEINNSAAAPASNTNNAGELGAKMEGDVKVKKGMVTLNDEDVFTLDFLTNKFGSFTLKNMAGNDLIFFKLESYKDYKEMSSSNPNGNVSYWEIYFPNDDQLLCEIKNTKKRMISLMLEKGVFNADYSISKAGMEKLAKQLGTPYTKKRSE